MNMEVLLYNGEKYCDGCPALEEFKKKCEHCGTYDVITARCCELLQPFNNSIYNRWEIPYDGTGFVRHRLCPLKRKDNNEKDTDNR